MHVSPNVPSVTEREAATVATALRDAVQATSVRAFRAYAAGEGGGPRSGDIHRVVRFAIKKEKTKAAAAVHPPACSAAQRKQCSSGHGKAEACHLSGGVPMIGSSSAFVDPLPPGAAIAFGGWLDIARLFLRRSGTAAEVCEACQTINLGSTGFCKGCKGKLPGYFAVLRAVESTASSDGESWVTGRTRGYVLTAIGLAIVLAAVFSALAPEHAQPFLSDALAAEHAPISASVSPGAASFDTARAIPLEQGVTEPAPTKDAHATVEVFKDPPLPAREARAPVPPGQHSSPRAVARAWRRPAPSPLPAYTAPRSVAACVGLNFVARAVCINNRCAERRAGRRAECREAVRQRQIDEAHRNPMLLGRGAEAATAPRAS
jgi:hypothetical protein